MTVGGPGCCGGIIPIYLLGSLRPGAEPVSRRRVGRL